LKYRFSFTAANAMIPEFIKVGQLVHQGRTIPELDADVLGKGKIATNKREFRELKYRINSLTPKQIEILADGNYDEQRQITHVALSKTYQFYSDFVTEVLAEKVQVFDYSLTDLDYNTFISKKKVDHPKLETITVTTQKKVKQVVYRMLEQVGLVDSALNPTILTQIIQPRVEQAILEDDPQLLALFLYDQHRIKSML